MPDIFLSYSRDDQAIARRFAEGFRNAGLSVWWDQALNPGEAFDKVTEKALDDARTVVVLWSKKSVDSRWVRSEAMQANTSGKLVPVMIESCKRPIMFELTHTADLSTWKGDASDGAWQDFLAGVQRFSRTGGSAAEPLAVATRSKPVVPWVIAVPLALTLIVGAALLFFKGKIAGVVAGNNAVVTVPVAAAPAAAPAAPAAAGQGEVSLAVLPFVNMSSDKEQEYFSDGLTEELLNQLAQIKDLRVTARTSSFAFKGKSEDLREVGKKLDVAYILEGSVRKDGKHLAITAQLIDSRTNDHLWSQTFKRELTDIFSIQEDISKSVASALRVTLGVGKASRGGTSNVTAYDIYLRAVGLAGQNSLPATHRAIQLLREAVRLDPNFTDAWFSLYLNLFSSVAADPAAEASVRWEQEEIRARLEMLAPDNPVTRNVRMNLYLRQHKWAEAEAEAHAVAATRPAPGAAADARSHAIVLALTGRSNEAVEKFKRMQRSDPLSKELSGWLQNVLDRAGRIEEAHAEYERSKDLGDTSAGADWNEFVRLWAKPGTPPATIAAQFRLYLKEEDRPMDLDLLLMEKLGDRAAAQAAIRKAFAEPKSRSISEWRRMSHYADHFGDTDLALAALRKQFIDLHSEFYLYLWDSYETGVRTDPRFKQILRELGLVKFFRTSGEWADACKPVGNDDFECH